MSARLVKICGINSADAFDAAAESGADYVGFVFCAASPRNVTPDQAAAISARQEGGPKRVGLFVNPGKSEIEAALAVVKLDILQIHGTAASIAALGLDMPVWQALGIATQADFPAPAQAIAGYVVEAKPPPGATRPGGNAVIADWELLSRFRPTKPWLLAGGLNPDNVQAALRQTGAPGADV
ncbi:MAG: N-(5'-phosphoribosyl)anthranilate isomerase, partial [Acidocella sp. 20-61-6]